MAKYCTKCGKKLDGKPCDCENQTQTVTTTSNFDFNHLLDVVKGMFTKPVDTLNNFIGDHNLSYGLVLLGVNALIIALFCCLGMKEIFTFVSGSMSAFLIQSSIEFPYAEVFFKSLVFVILGYAILAGLFYLIADKLFKGPSSYQKMITLFGATSVILSATLLGSIVLMYVSTQLMFVWLCCGLLLQSVYTIQGLKMAINIDENKLGYVYAVVYAILLIVTIFILPRIMG